MIVAGIQHDIEWADRDANFARLAPKIAGAAASGAELVLLTETFSTGFGFTEPGFEPEPEGGPSSAFLAAQAAEHGIWVGGSCPELRPRNELPSNSFVLAGPDGTQHRYRKIHPFTHAGEERFVQAGDEFVTVDVVSRAGERLRVTLFVCYDLRFADEFWQLAPATDVYLVPANWPARRREHWMALLRARAIENQAYVVGINRVGTAPSSERGGTAGNTLEYAGDSLIVDPLGQVLASASQVESTITADVTAARVADVRDKFRFLQDRR